MFSGGPIFHLNPLCAIPNVVQGYPLFTSLTPRKVYALKRKHVEFPYWQFEAPGLFFIIVCIASGFVMSESTRSPLQQQIVFPSSQVIFDA